MAERITSIALQAFRGIPSNLTVDLPNGRSCLVLGDNGTGKSSIADAIEWYFRGHIELLTKEGRSDAFRHSGAAQGLETRVAISTDGSLGGVTTRLAPSRQVVRDVGRSELFLLRGRTLADFVDKTKGEKWRALAELLGFDAIDETRRDLQRVKNELQGVAEGAASDLALTRSALNQSIPAVSATAVVQAMSEKCEAAGVQAPASLEEALDPEWLQAIVPTGSQDQRAMTLQSALAEVQAAAGKSVALDPIDVWNQFVTAARRADQLQLGLYRAADSLLSSGHAQAGQCPLCDQPVDLDALAEEVAAELHALEGAAQALQAAQQAVRQCIGAVSNAHRSRASTAARAQGEGVELKELPGSLANDLARCVETSSVIDRQAVERYQEEILTWDAAALVTLQTASPTPATARDRALVEIGILHTKAAAWQSAIRNDSDARAAAILASRLFELYQTTQRDHFSAIIQQISSRAAAVYAFLHPEGGIGAIAVETVGEKGAELSVDFHGRKELPPHRVLSESHLNSLGIALFLAMVETFNNHIGFLVLDDVVNSFDREHRGRVAELLVQEFGETQLIVLTHDEQFFTHLSRRAPSWVQEHFTSWSYAEGPRTRQYEGDLLLVEANEVLSSGDRVGAAQKSRRALEEFLQEACEALEALLPFRRGQRNDQRMVEEVMMGMRRTLRDRARPLYDEIAPLLTALSADLQAVLNVESHAGRGGASKQEVSDAIAHIVDLRSRFVCAECDTRVWHVGSPNAYRCRCGQSQFPPPGGAERPRA